MVDVIWVLDWLVISDVPGASLYSAEWPRIDSVKIKVLVTHHTM